MDLTSDAFPAALKLLIGSTMKPGFEILDHLVEGDKMHLKAVKRGPAE